MTAQAEQQGVPRKNPPASTIASRLRHFMRMNPPVYIGYKIDENLQKECEAAMLHTSMDFSSLMARVQQLEENKKRRHTRALHRSRQAEKKFSGKSSNEIRDKPRFNKGIYHQGE